MSNCPLPIGEWLLFKKNTCFGSTKDHLGIIIAASDNQLVAVPINATSQIANVQEFARHRNIDPEVSIVTVSPNSAESGHHFSKPTAFDCNRVNRIPYDILETWYRASRITEVSYNNPVSPSLIENIKNGILASPMVDEYTKDIIRNTFPS